MSSLGPILAALAIGAVGGVIAEWATLPLPWMLGPMIFCLLAVMAGAPIKGPIKIRPMMVLVLGVMLGSGFTPDMVDRIGDWAASLALLLVYVAVAGAVIYPYFRKVAGYDPVTAYFSGMPGGLNEMMIVGGAMGGDDRVIALTHASRVLLAVMIIPIAFRFLEGVDTSDRGAYEISILDMAGSDLAILTACAVLGWPIGKWLKLPAGALLGPMLLSAATHLSGMTSAPPPIEVLNVAQWVIGTTIGCRFSGVARREILRIMAIALGATVILIALSVLFAAALHLATDLDPRQVILAYAPGGLAEMSLVALALGADVAFVATHHIIRISVVVVAAPIIFRRTGLKRTAAPSD